MVNTGDLREQPQYSIHIEWSEDWIVKLPMRFFGFLVNEVVWPSNPTKWLTCLSTMRRQHRHDQTNSIKVPTLFYLFSWQLFYQIKTKMIIKTINPRCFKNINRPLVWTWIVIYNLICLFSSCLPKLVVYNKKLDVDLLFKNIILNELMP